MIDYNLPPTEVLGQIKEAYSGNQIAPGRFQAFEVVDYLVRLVEESVQLASEIGHTCHVPACKCKEEFWIDLAKRMSQGASQSRTGGDEGAGS